jgi:aminoglycoside 6'-N-acetyltransferase I
VAFSKRLETDRAFGTAAQLRQ